MAGIAKWKTRLIDGAAIEAGWRVLDLACGTGDLAFDAARRGARVVGLDITPRMVELARAKARSGRTRVDRRRHDRAAGSDGGRSISSPPATACATCRILPRALAEIHRVLRPGGRVCSLDFDRPETGWIRAVYLTYLTVVGSSLGWVLHRDPDTYRYIPASIRRYPGARGVVALMEQAGFRDVRHVRVLGGFMAIHTARK